MNSFNSQLIDRKIHRPLLFNIMVWVFSYVVLLFVFTKGKTPMKIDFVYTLSFLVTVAIPVLINLYLLIPKFLTKERYLLYGVSLFLNLALFVFLNVSFLEPVLDYLLPNYFFISYTTLTGICFIFIIFMIVISLLKLSEEWFYFNKEENKKLKRDNQHIQMQLNSLRSQINPHFLFNSLNVVYALAIENRDETKDAIVQLSDILRYVIYDSNAKTITLKEEMILLKNYIDFHKFRSHNYKNVSFEAAIEDKDYPLYPMLLLPLVENSFKHSTNSEGKDVFIKITIEQNQDMLSFKIKNSNTLQTNISSDKYSGIGLENVKNSLELVYPNSHSFTVNERAETFSVDLKLMNKKTVSNEN